MFIANNILIPEIQELLQEGNVVTFRVRGRSMRPMIEGDRDSVELAPCHGDIHLGDIILAEVAPKQYALHRIVEIEGNTLTMRGDGNPYGKEVFQREAVVGRAQAFIRKGKRISMQSFQWKIYSYFWTRLLPIRKYLLFLCYPHIPQRFLRHL